MKIPLLKNISIPARTKTIKALMSRLLWVKTIPLIYTSMKHFTLERANLHSIPEKNVLNSQTFYFSILFQRPFLSAFRGLLSRDTPSSELCILFIVYFYSFHTYFTSFTHFTLHFLCIYIARAEHFLIPDDAVDRRKLGFQFLLFKQQFKDVRANCFCASLLRT